MFASVVLLLISTALIPVVSEKLGGNEKIAIIGAGIGGTSCAWHLRQELPLAELDVFDFEERIGGRLATTEIDGKFYEIGGSVIHPLNKYMIYFRDYFGFEKSGERPEGVTGIFDGSQFKFKSSIHWIITIFKLLWRYGWDVIFMSRLVDDLMQKFARIYALQDNGYAFTTVDLLLDSLSPEFIGLSRMPLYQLLRQRSFGDLFIYEIAQAVGLVNYGQSVDQLRGFVGSVSLAGSENGLWSVKGGNFRVAEALLSNSTATIYRCKVTSITKQLDATFDLTCVDTLHPFHKMEMVLRGYTRVVIAHPLIEHDESELSFDETSFRLRFNNIPLATELPVGTFHTTVATVVEGELSEKAFHQLNGEAGANAEEMTSIVSCNSDTFYKSISQLCDVNCTADVELSTVELTGVKPGPRRRVWKIFSEEKLTNAQLEFLFDSLNRKKEKKWLAYPEYVHYFKRDIPFELSDKVYYINAIEWAASAMEMSLVGSKNIALLIRNDIFGDRLLNDPKTPNLELVARGEL